MNRDELVICPACGHPGCALCRRAADVAEPASSEESIPSSVDATTASTPAAASAPATGVGSTPASAEGSSTAGSWPPVEEGESRFPAPAVFLAAGAVALVALMLLGYFAFSSGGGEYEEFDLTLSDSFSSSSEPFTVRAGQKFRFNLTNAGPSFFHDLRLERNGRRGLSSDAVPPGGRAQLVGQIDRVGTYVLVDGIDDDDIGILIVKR